MRRRFHSLRRRYALRWHRTQARDGDIFDGCVYGCLIVVGIYALIGVLILVLVHR